METINQLQTLDYVYLFLGFISILTVWKVLSELWEGTIGKLGIETKGMRKRREEHDLLIQTSKNLSELQKKHKEDVEQSIEYDKKIQNELSTFMSEMKDSISEVKMKIEQYADNRIHDREQSFQIQHELTDEQKEIRNVQKELSYSLKHILDMFIDKSIDDMRWEINNFATNVSEGRPCNKDSFKHCISVYEKYEKILKEYGLKNGEVEISMEIINEAYAEKLKEGF